MNDPLTGIIVLGKEAERGTTVFNVRAFGMIQMVAMKPGTLRLLWEPKKRKAKKGASK